MIFALLSEAPCVHRGHFSFCVWLACKQPFPRPVPPVFMGAALFLFAPHEFFWRSPVAFGSVSLGRFFFFNPSPRQPPNLDASRLFLFFLGVGQPIYWCPLDFSANRVAPPLVRWTLRGCWCTLASPPQANWSTETRLFPATKTQTTVEFYAPINAP